MNPGPTLQGVFERFTDRARRVLVLAQDEARLLNHNFIGPEHILLGLLHDGEGVAAQVLAEFDVTLDATANTSTVRNGAHPALIAALAIAAIAATTLAGAWFFQLVLDIRPCPLCLEQRYAYYFAIPFGALTALAAGSAPNGIAK